MSDRSPAATASTRLLAVFDGRGPLLDAVREVRAEGVGELTAFLPAYDGEIVALTAPRARTVVGSAIGGGLAGAVIGLAFPLWVMARWPTVILGGKPLLAIPPAVVIAFAVTVLFASCAVAAAFLRDGAHARRHARSAYDRAFTDASYGLLIACRASRVPRAIELVGRAGAVRWRVV